METEQIENSIKLIQDVTSGIGSQAEALSCIIQKLKDEQNNILDCSQVSFLHPTLILGLSALLHKYRSVGVSCEIAKTSYEVDKYLEIVKFPEGLQPDRDTDWKAKLEGYRKKNYLPIINFPTDPSVDSANFRNAVLSKVNDLIADRLEINPSEITPISFFISEFTDNIVEHAGVKRGKIMTQFYPQKGFLEVCILDEGKTLLGSYLEARQKIFTDVDAIKAAVSGNSTKSPERGFGIPQSTNLIIKGLEGKILMLSGQGMLTNQVIINYSSHWPGTLLSIKIPRVPKTGWQKYIYS